MFAVLITGPPGAGKTSVLTALVDALSADLARLRDAVGADEDYLVRLEAQPATLVQRIIAREPESWSGLSELVAHAQELAGLD